MKYGKEIILPEKDARKMHEIYIRWSNALNEAIAEDAEAMKSIGEQPWQCVFTTTLCKVFVGAHLDQINDEILLNHPEIVKETMLEVVGIAIDRFIESI